MVHWLVKLHSNINTGTKKNKIIQKIPRDFEDNFLKKRTKRKNETIKNVDPEAPGNNCTRTIPGLPFARNGN